VNASSENQTPPLLRLSDRVSILPVIHGSGQFALTVRRWFLEHSPDCLAVPLPASFREQVEEAVLELPRPSMVMQPPTPRFDSESSPSDWSTPSWGQQQWNASEDEDDDDEEDDDVPPTSFVPIDPCQPVIMAIRAAMGEHVPRAYVDLETDPFCPHSAVMPDPFAVRKVSPEMFAAAVLPSIARPHDGQAVDRIKYMAIQLRELEKRHQRILMVCSVLDWPWIREAYNRLDPNSGSPIEGDVKPEHDLVEPVTRYCVDSKSLLFLFGELPFITGLYERARAELDDDEDLQIDGVKELMLAARDNYRQELGSRARRITPLLLSKCLTYIRNLSLIHRRMTPDLVTIITASKQILGDQFALHVAELANHYPFLESAEDFDGADVLPHVKLGIDQARLPDGDTVSIVSRLPGPPISWQRIELSRRPTEFEKERWQYQWNPYQQCSYPPEDTQIENFRTRVFDRAKAIIGNDLARTEKFTTSVKDGIDIRDTLRHWYEKQIYVKVAPPSRGLLDACVMLFDSPSDPRTYPWRTTWFAEHDQESTLAFYATRFEDEMVGPGIGLSIYGGAMFLYPPVMLPDIWNDIRLDYATTLEERLIAAACLHSRGRQIAILSALPPGSGWQRLARRHKKQLVHVPISSFSDEQVQQLRMVHVLNGTKVRSYAADFIRKV